MYIKSLEVVLWLTEILNFFFTQFFLYLSFWIVPYVMILGSWIFYSLIANLLFLSQCIFFSDTVIFISGKSIWALSCLLCPLSPPFNMISLSSRFMNIWHTVVITFIVLVYQRYVSSGIILIDFYAIIYCIFLFLCMLCNFWLDTW